MNRFKEIMVGLFGTIGYIFVAVIRMVISILPFLMIGGGFLLTFALIIINYFFPISSIVFWIWGLVCAIKGIQDIWAILFYIAFVIIWIPFFISTIISLFSNQRERY